MSEIAGIRTHTSNAQHFQPDRSLAVALAVFSCYHQQKPT